MNLTHLAETVPIYALRANLGRDPQFQQLKVVRIHVFPTSLSLIELNLRVVHHDCRACT